MLVYVIRHGQSETNVTGVRAGQTDIKLTPKGYEDARGAAEKLKDIRFDRVFSSDLIRASETARTAIPGIEPELVREIREMDIGRIAGYTNEQCAEIYGSLWTENFSVHNYRPFGGEDEDLLMARTSSFMKRLESLGNDCRNVAVFSHGGTIRCMLRYVLDAPVSWRKFFAINCGITIFEYSDGFWSLRAFNR